MIASDDRRTRRLFISLAFVLAGTFVAFHAPFLPESLEDLDSINFALGLRRFDVAHHQPHPPGYPLFILLARAMHVVVPREVAALAALSILAGAAGALAIVALHRRLHATPWTWSIAAGAIAVTSPLYWLTASRPLSDMTGLAAAVAVQAMTLAARSANGLMTAALCAGLATGIRSQVLWLTAPLLLWTVTRGRTPTGDRPPHWTGAAGAFVLGALLWFVPLIAVSGGPRAYWQALSSQGGEDLSGIQMLWTTPSARTFLDALYFAFVAPWALWPAAIVVLVASALGGVVLWRAERRQLEMLAVAFVPYLVFDILFQETFTSRYALPLVVPIAFLAARGLQGLPARTAVVALVAVVMWNAHVGGRSVAALGSGPAPMFRLLADMRAAEAGGPPPVLAPDRRHSFDLRRPMAWLGDSAPTFERQLPAPPQREWLEAAKYWDAGGRAPVWFVVDPRRASIDLVQHGAPSEYRWSVPYPVLLSGTRPGDADWYRVDRPDWYVGDGWALTPEAAGVARASAGLADDAALEARIATRGLPGYLMIGGRNLSTVAASIAIELAGMRVAEFEARPGFFARFVGLTPMPGSDYLSARVIRSPGSRLAIEQFGAAGGLQPRPLLAFGAGWQEQELDPATGRRWRWLSDRGELQYVAGDRGVLHIEGESPRRYYSGQSRLLVRSGDLVLRDVTIASDFNLDVDLPPSHQPSTIVVETDQTHVPAETGWRRSQDRRRLGLRIFRCELRPVSAPDTAASFPPAR